MNDPRQFDELARRKLEEREFAFDEAAWTDMQRILAKDRGRSGAWYRSTSVWWTFAGAAVLLIGLGLWWNTGEQQPAAVAETVEVNATGPTEATDAKAGTPSANAAMVPDPVARVTVAEPEEPGQKTLPQARKDEPHILQPAAPRTEPNGTTIAENKTNEPEVPMLVPVTTIAVVDEPATSEPVDGTNAVTDDQVQDPGTGPPNLGIAPVVPALVSGVAVADQVGDQGTSVTHDVAADPATNDEGNEPVPDPDVTTPAVVSAASPADSATTGNDPSITAATTPAPPVLVPAKAPWEISALGGMMLGSSNYSGANSDAWKDDVSSLWAPSFGGELMHMGRNFGLGVGLHYTTYAEHLQVDEQRVTETLISDSNYFEQAPLMLLIITDVVVIDGVTYYVTETLDTMINVLVRSTMSTTGERVVVPARDQTNRVSYFEIPVLFDAHLVQGPWSLGIRGGPMVGLLSGRRGVVPNAAMDGYTDFSDQHFNEVVFGYTARAYVRYRFSDAWSVGLEPGIKGQFMNGLSEGDLSRRTTAWGGMLSVSYRLR